MDDSPTIRDPRVLAAMRAVPRQRFVPQELARMADEDRPLPIGYGQTISQPYVVAYMSELLQVEPGMRVLEVGTGSGYQAAILAALGAEVFSVEIIPALAERARALLTELGYTRVHIRVGDGSQGWPEEAPFERIIATAAPPFIPPPLLDQLGPGARMVVPVGTAVQYLKVVDKLADGSLRFHDALPVRFVPMTGQAQR